MIRSISFIFRKKKTFPETYEDEENNKEKKFSSASTQTQMTAKKIDAYRKMIINLTESIELLQDRVRDLDEENSSLFSKIEEIIDVHNSHNQIPIHLLNELMEIWEKSENKNCPICYDKIDWEDIHITNCGHIFHSECITPVYNITNKCPECRQCLNTRKKINSILIQR